MSQPLNYRSAMLTQGTRECPHPPSGSLVGPRSRESPQATAWRTARRSVSTQHRRRLIRRQIRGGLGIAIGRAANSAGSPVDGAVNSVQGRGEGDDPVADPVGRKRAVCRRATAVTQADCSFSSGFRRLPRRWLGLAFRALDLEPARGISPVPRVPVQSFAAEPGVSTHRDQGRTRLAHRLGANAWIARTLRLPPLCQGIERDHFASSLYQFSLVDCEITGNEKFELGTTQWLRRLGRQTDQARGCGCRQLS